ncbi:MAG TPA: acyl-CoA dehydrogenase family protein [Spirochaetota bacterium]|nr:acyl-CoA dehydrogenase family protein [Spirochaetota bacterium]HOS39353.1 acyl-CoA dehydrogenase family protein [Spirochaetota bacterium]HPU90419.1 acyl-CoA dehydrogenase family protein [Spirochaetota bacterium]
MNAIINDMYVAERQAFADLARDFCSKRLIEGREERDRYPFGGLMEEAIGDAAAVGFYGINSPVDYGGVEMNATMLASILERISREDAGMAAIIFANAAALEVLRVAAEQTGCADVYGRIHSLGTAPIAFQSYAGPEECELPTVDAHSLMSGGVGFLALAPIAEYAVIPARHGAGARYAYYLVALASEGVRVHDPIVSLGLRGCPAADVTFERVPATLIGTGDGPGYFDSMRASLSIAAAAISLGILKGSLRDAMRYAADRYQGGRQIIDWGQVRMMLANMAVEERIAEACLDTAYRELDSGMPGWQLTALAAAIHVGELAVRATADGVQLFGGNGYTKDYPQEKRMRDARQAQCLLGMAPLRKMALVDRVIEERL